MRTEAGPDAGGEAVVPWRALVDVATRRLRAAGIDNADQEARWIAERAGGFEPLRHLPGSGGPLVVLYASDLEEMLTAVKGAGAKITKEIFTFPGGRRFHFKDPNGNELAVWSDR